MLGDAGAPRRRNARRSAVPARCGHRRCLRERSVRRRDQRATAFTGPTAKASTLSSSRGYAADAYGCCALGRRARARIRAMRASKVRFTAVKLAADRRGWVDLRRPPSGLRQPISFDLLRSRPEGLLRSVQRRQPVAQPLRQVRLIRDPGHVSGSSATVSGSSAMGWSIFDSGAGRPAAVSGSGPVKSCGPLNGSRGRRSTPVAWISSSASDHTTGSGASSAAALELFGLGFSSARASSASRGTPSAGRWVAALERHASPRRGRRSPARGTAGASYRLRAGLAAGPSAPITLGAP